MNDRRTNTLILAAVCIAVAMTFAASMVARASHSEPLPLRASVEEVAVSGPNEVTDCDKVVKNGNCCAALHCAVGIVLTAATQAYSPFSSEVAAETPDSPRSQSIWRLERPPKQPFLPYPQSR